MAILGLVWITALLSVASANISNDPVVIGQTFMAGSDDPTDGSTAWALTSHGISEKLFTVDQGGNIVAQLGESVKKLDTLSWEVKLKAGSLFSDGTPVTAQHVADAFTELNNINSNAQASLGTMTIEPLDDLRLNIQSSNAHPMLEAVLAEWVFVVYMVKGNNRFFTGPFAIDNFVAGDRIELTPNPYYSRASERELIVPELVIKKYADGDAVAAALKTGDIEMGFHLPIDTLPELRSTEGITVKSFEVGYQYMMFHNLRRSPLSDLNVRKAVDMAIDRYVLTQVLSGGDATRSFFPEKTPYSLDETEPHADRSGAEDLLDDAGWTKNGDGKREKGGVLLNLTLIAYPFRPGLGIMQPKIKEQLEDLGITVDARNVPLWDGSNTILADQDYDLLMWAQHTLPAGDPAWFLNSFFRSDGGNNHAGLSSSTIDGLIDALGNTETMQARLSATKTAHNGILDEVPVSMLLTPAWHVGLSSRLSQYEPWGSDYYVIRSDFGVGPAPTTSVNVQDDDETGSADRVMISGLAVAASFLLLAWKN